VVGSRVSSEIELPGGPDLSPKTIKVVLAILLLAGGVLRVAIAWQPLPFLISSNMLLNDDSFYSLNIARNIALGEGMTHDGVNRTNGFQPLFVALMVPLYAVVQGGKVLPVHLGLTLMGLIDVGTAVLLFLLVRRLGSAAGGLAAAVLWLTSAEVIGQALNGLETSIVVFLVALSTLFYVARIRRAAECRVRDMIVMGALLGLLVLSRIDGLIYAGALGLDQLVLRLKRRDLGSWVRGLGALAAAFVVTWSPWLLVGLVGFGELLPTSGQATRFLSIAHDRGRMSHVPFDFDADRPSAAYLEVLTARGASQLETLVARVVSPIAATAHALGTRSAPLTAVILLIVAAVTWILGRRRARNGLPGPADVAFTVPFCVLLWLAYTYYIFGQWHFPRYFMPIAFFVAGAVGLAAGAALDAVSMSAERGGTAATLAIVVALAAPGFLGSVSLHVRAVHMRSPSFSDVNGGYIEGARLLDQVSRPGDVCGAFQSGILGYFSDRQIINLGGVVNASALQAMRSGTLMEYIDSQNIRFIADWPVNVHDDLLAPFSEPGGIARLRPVARGRWVTVYRVE